MFLEFKNQVEVLIKNAIKDAIKSHSCEIEDLNLEPSIHSDIATNVAFRLAPILKKNPSDIAKDIVNSIEIPTDSFIEKIEAQGPYINIYAKKEYLIETINRINEQIHNFGGKFLTGRVIIEHTSANPNGPLHVGHIRNSIIGDTLVRIFTHAGHSVESQYYINDMGRQIAIVSWGISHFNYDYSKENCMNQKSDHMIADIYIKANKELKECPEKNEDIAKLMNLIEVGEEDTVNKFKQAVDFAIKGIKESLVRMNIHHDKFVYESDYIRLGLVENVISELEQCDCIEIDEGATIVNLSKYGFEKNLVIKRADGTSLYVTRDLAYHVWKGENADQMINVLGTDHKLISSQLDATLKIIGKKTPKIVIFEFVSLPEGSMSTRAGKFIAADELLDKIENEAYLEVNKRKGEKSEEEKRKIANIVGIGAVRYDIVKVSPEKSTVFNWESALDFEKQSAPYIQYSHARACSILKKAKSKGININAYKINPLLIKEDSEIDLIKLMSRFDYEINKSVKALKPHIIAIYARELADAFNQFYRLVPVITDDEELSKNRLVITNCARIVLFNVLKVLGIVAPESM